MNAFNQSINALSGSDAKAERLKAIQTHKGKTGRFDCADLSPDKTLSIPVSNDGVLVTFKCFLIDDATISSESILYPCQKSNFTPF